MPNKTSPHTAHTAVYALLTGFTSLPAGSLGCSRNGSCPRSIAGTPHGIASGATRSGVGPNRSECLGDRRHMLVLSVLVRHPALLHRLLAQLLLRLEMCAGLPVALGPVAGLENYSWNNSEATRRRGNADCAEPRRHTGTVG